MDKQKTVQSDRHRTIVQSRATMTESETMTQQGTIKRKMMVTRDLDLVSLFDMMKTTIYNTLC